MKSTHAGACAVGSAFLLLIGVGGAACALAQNAALAQPHQSYADGVIGLQDVAYEIVPDFHPLRADLYIPAQKARSVVVWMHGGGWGVGDPRMGEGGTYGPWPNVLAKLAARGHLVMAINYRFTGEARFPAQVQDVKAAIRWIRSNAAQYGADAGNVYVWGESAGGFLSVMAGTTCGAAALEPLAPRTGGPAPPPGMLTVHVDPAQSDCVQGAVDWFGPTDLIRMDEQMLPNSPMHHNPPTSPESKLLGCTLPSCPKSLLDEATSLTYITASTPPFLIMHGTSDHSVPLQQSEELYQALRAKGVAAQLVEVVGADHGFAGATPQAKAHLIDMVFDWLDHPGGSGKQTAQSGAPANAPPATFGPPQG